MANHHPTQSQPSAQPDTPSQLQPASPAQLGQPGQQRTTRGPRSLVTMALTIAVAHLSRVPTLKGLPDFLISQLARLVVQRGHPLTLATLQHFLPYLGQRHTLALPIRLEELDLEGAGNLSARAWIRFLEGRGGHFLRKLRVGPGCGGLNNEVLLVLAEKCPGLERLKIVSSGGGGAITDVGIAALAGLTRLKRLSLCMGQMVRVSVDVVIGVIRAVGAQLETLVLEEFFNANDAVLEAIHETCRCLRKLKITGAPCLTDGGLAKLFRDWENPGLEYVEFSGRKDQWVSGRFYGGRLEGLWLDGFYALMAHSRTTLVQLKVGYSRKLLDWVMPDVFDKKRNEWPALRKLDLRGVWAATDAVVKAAFKSCPNLEEVIVYDCEDVYKVRPPPGKTIVGLVTRRGSYWGRHPKNSGVGWVAAEPRKTKEFYILSVGNEL
ncbi:DNA repair protein rad7-like protein [Thermochaetoides thermophila DSM 1495]|uniref:DNA repair protein rad7-like protein n=1 Tax=Chaetomium thermophilum (strain DSM 1495 / CBS 144.50 / IMI 039719) TaxID=759272 RepID=G0SE24_CHATD|nr:DNA repair protein rad7-like protein [Thermochaetoides thermophila DSM 1495]EGS18201.1 DNA repair protein rad7-like protein [Thermochaetoides thermophila DSM 1495]